MLTIPLKIGPTNVKHRPTARWYINDYILSCRSSHITITYCYYYYLFLLLKRIGDWNCLMPFRVYVTDLHCFRYSSVHVLRYNRNLLRCA